MAIFLQLIPILAVGLLAPAMAAAQHDQHGAHAPDAIGSRSVSFTTSCAPTVRDDINTAVALLHSFWWPESIRQFEAVLTQDPGCAVAHWGIALNIWGNPFGGLRNPETITRGAQAIARGREAATASPRERGLLDAAALLFRDSNPGSQRQRVREYEAAMAALVTAHPGDVELRIFYALAITQSAEPSDKTYAKAIEAAAILEPLFEQMPEHPGLAHYIIHAFDAPPLAARALEAARRYASLAPAVPHALHMPSHTFTRVGAWKESIETNQRSADAARKAGGVGEEMHALDYQTYAYLQIAQDVQARRVVAHAAGLAGTGNAFAGAAIPARYALERGDWAATAALVVTPAPNTLYTEAITHFARALGAARRGDPEAASADITRLGQIATALASKEERYWAEQVDIQRRVTSAWQTYARGQRETGLAELRAAADAEDQTDKAAVTPGPLAPARELLGDMWLDAGRPSDALEAYEATMAKEPNRFRGVYGAARAAELAGQRDKAQTYYQLLLTIAEDADTDRPELLHARAFRIR